MGESLSRTTWEMEKHTDKKAYQIRKQEERESRMALRDFQKHLTEEEVEMEERRGRNPKMEELMRALHESLDNLEGDGLGVYKGA